MLAGLLNEVAQNTFDVCPKLEKLSFNTNQLTTFPSEMLRNCENLIYFEVINFMVASVPENLFEMTENLDAFIVIGNLTSLPEKLLHNMKKLRYCIESS